MFKKILIANRGEIAFRAVRECREMGISSVAVYSDADAEALFVKHADEKYPLGDPAPLNSYLNMQKILDIAKKSGSEAIYPGYGFLAENPKFVELCEQNGIVFIGPPSTSMNRAKPKHKARKLMKDNGIPTAPGTDDAIENISDTAAVKAVIETAAKIGYPVIVKPSGGGGGIGMKVAKDQAELEGAMKYAESRGSSSFGISAFYLERYFTKAKHIEFQVMADTKGNYVYVGERECSVQRRYQKLIEEAPSMIMTPELRKRMGEDSVKVAKALQYVNALTVEYIFSADTGEYFFNECNTRLQVEHPVTELLTGFNLIKEQIRVAAGEKLSFTQADVQPRGWAIECRINAEDPYKGFVPSPAKITNYLAPGGFGIRIDSGVYSGYTVPFQYDPLMLKLLSWGKDRTEAIECMKRALGEFVIEGLQTSIPFHKLALDDEVFRSGKYTTNFVEEQGLVKKLMASRAKPA